MRKVVLLGDSIFDNGEYVAPKRAVGDLLKKEIADLNIDAEMYDMAVDGAMTKDVIDQVHRIKNTVREATDVFISCGGNDALSVANVLYLDAVDVYSALWTMARVRNDFREEYVKMLNYITQCTPANIKVCTIYNKIPSLGEAERTALALFNEVILEEAAKRSLGVIDLRVICDEEGDYSEVSSIEPSEQGGRKIVDAIMESMGDMPQKETRDMYEVLEAPGVGFTLRIVRDCMAHGSGRFTAGAGVVFWHSSPTDSLDEALAEIKKRVSA